MIEGGVSVPRPAQFLARVSENQITVYFASLFVAFWSQILILKIIINQKNIRVANAGYAEWYYPKVDEFCNTGVKLMPLADSDEMA